MPMVKRITITMDGYECILCREIYVVILAIEKDEGCPECGGPSNYIETIEVPLDST